MVASEICRRKTPQCNDLSHFKLLMGTQAILPGDIVWYILSPSSSNKFHTPLSQTLQHITTQRPADNMGSSIQENTGVFTFPHQSHPRPARVLKALPSSWPLQSHPLYPPGPRTADTIAFSNIISSSRIILTT